MMLLRKYGTVFWVFKTTIVKRRCEYCPRASTPCTPSLQIPFGYWLFYICLRITMASEKIDQFSVLFKLFSTISYSFHANTNILAPILTILLSCLYMKQLTAFIHLFYKDRLHWLHNIHRLHLCCGCWCPTLSLWLFLPYYIPSLYICPLCFPCLKIPQCFTHISCLSWKGSGKGKMPNSSSKLWRGGFSKSF